MLDCAAPMTARILDGKSLAAATRTALKDKVDALVQRGVRPALHKRIHLLLQRGARRRGKGFSVEDPGRHGGRAV